jgi:endoglucanase
MKWTTCCTLCALLAGALALGCAPGGAGGEAAGAESPTNAPANVTRCGPDGLIDDCEDNNNQVANLGGRNGYWYTYADEAGTQINPPAGSAFTMSEGGAHGSGYAARFWGKVSANGSPLYAGVGLNWVDPKDAYDASKYGGIAFWAKKAPSTYGKLRLKIPDVNTDPQGGVCKECYNDFGMDIDLTEAWTEYVVTWDTAKQMPYWGNPTPEKITPSKIYGFQVQVTRANEQYDVWVDDITFIGCGK